ncbi:MAG: hypothetical protein GKR95_17660 [Gammaproteobacteria bacterium]|nr:hypothetical protein [Gammaproteobacteria bacterium]
MNTNDWLTFLSALLAMLSVLIPFFVNWLDKSSTLRQSAYVIELLNAKDQLIEIREQRLASNTSPMLMERINSLLLGIDKELDRGSEKRSLTALVSLMLVEAVLFLSAIFLQVSESMTRFLKGKSYENGMYFLEGIFQYQGVRMSMMAVFISVSVYLVIQISHKVFQKFDSVILANCFLLLLFNVLFIVVTVLGGVTLLVLDPIVDWW